MILVAASVNIQDALFEIRASHKELDQFTLTPQITAWMRDEEICGELLFIVGRRAFVKFPRKHQTSVARLYEIDSFLIKFQLNPTTYQLQHTALDYIESHKIFDILINNPLYDTKQFYNPPTKPSAPAIQ